MPAQVDDLTIPAFLLRDPKERRPIPKPEPEHTETFPPLTPVPDTKGKRP